MLSLKRGIGTAGVVLNFLWCAFQKQFLTQGVEFEKRAWNSHFNGGLGKRAWNSHFNGGLGKSLLIISISFPAFLNRGVSSFIKLNETYMICIRHRGTRHWI